MAERMLEVAKTHDLLL